MHRSFIALATVALAAVAVHANPAVASVSHTSPSIITVKSNARGWMSQEAKKATTLVYVSDALHSVINIYPTTSKNPAPVGEIVSGLNGPQSMAVDKFGNLYVANLANSTVTEYAGIA